MRGAGELGDPHDRVLDVARRIHHQVGELVDDDEQVGVGHRACARCRAGATELHRSALALLKSSTWR
jgi:hypothetical protein